MLETGLIGALAPWGERVRVRGKAAPCKPLTPDLS